jgi:transcriptional regulator with XRE-family HTH domain
MVAIRIPNAPIDMVDTTDSDRRSSRNPTWTDAYIGRRILQRRKELGISQVELRRQIGLTFQQIQKFETGFNRMPASRLADIAKVLNASPGDFFPAVANEVPALRRGDLTEVMDAIDEMVERHQKTIDELQRLHRRLRRMEMQVPSDKGKADPHRRF